MKTRAKFIGTNSLDYVHGLEYRFVFYTIPTNAVSLQGKIVIEPLGLTGQKCEYDDQARMIAIMQNIIDNKGTFKP